MRSKSVLNERDFLDGDNGDTIERLLMYNLAGKQERDLSTSISPIDTSSFVNLTRLVSHPFEILSKSFLLDHSGKHQCYRI